MIRQNGQQKNRNALRDQRGVSMIFVLAALLFLLTVAASVIVASGAGVAARLNKQNANQLFLYTQSTQKTIQFSLQNSAEDLGCPVNGQENRPQTLGGQVLRTLYHRFSGEDNETDGLRLELTPLLNDLSELGDTVQVAMDFLPVGGQPVMTVYPAVTQDVYDEDQNLLFVAETDPWHAVFSAEVRVTVTAAYRGKALRTVAVYAFSGGELEARSKAPPGGESENTGVVSIAHTGEWRLLSFETVDIIQ